MPDSMADNPGREIDDLFVDLASMFSHGGGTRTTPRHDANGPQIFPDRGGGNPVVAVYELALEVVAGEAVPVMLRRLVDGARATFGAVSAAVTLGSPGSSQATVMLSGDPPIEGIAGWRTDKAYPVSGGGFPQGPMLVPDPERDGQSQEAENAPVATMIGVPLIEPAGPDHPAMGYLYLVDREDGTPFNADDLDLLRVLGRHASMAISRGQAQSGLAMGQHRIEAQLSQLRMIMDTLPAGVLVMVPPDGRVELANETALATILGGELQADASLKVYRDFDWFRADGAELTRSEHPGMLALRGERIGNRALILRTKAGEQIPVRVQSTPIYNADGTVARAVVLFLDVSRERAAEQVKDDFLSLISHEFRTPLTAIHGGALLLSQQGHAMDDETRQELLHDIGEESLRLDRMLGNLLSVSEIMAGRFQASTEPILVAPLVQPLMEEFRESSSNHSFTLDVEPDVPPAEGSPELLMQILRNLYENAVKYSPGGGEIRTVIRREDDWVAIAVEDTGLGISPEHVPHVFERFRRPGAEPTVRGMGLGLYLSRLLVDAQGGRIRASSAGPGQGATFVVELPMVPDWEREQEPDNGDLAE